MRRFLPICASALFLATVFVIPTTASAQCPIPREIMTASRTLTDAERTTIEQCVDANASLLGSESAAEISRGRHELVQPPRAPGVSEVFRRAYADAARARLREFIKGENEHRAVNALSVLQFLFTAESLDELADNAAKANQSREAVRIAAAQFLARASKQLAGANPPYSLNPAQSDALARKIREAAMEETSWVALVELGEALLQQSTWKLPPANQEGVRSEFLRVLGRQVEVARTSPEAMRAVLRSLVGVRNQIIELPASSRTAFAQQLAPILTSIQTLSKKPPADASDNLKRVFEQCGALVDRINGLLK